MRSLRSSVTGVVWRVLRFLNVLGVSALGPVRLLPIRQISEFSFPSPQVFLPAEPAVRAPNVVGQPTPEDDTFPALGYRRLSGALVTSNSRVSAVCSESSFLIPPAADPGPWSVGVGHPIVGGILRQDHQKVLINAKTSGAEIPGGVFVGTWSPQNWFHWIIDLLPSVYLANRLPSHYDSYPLLLPEGIDKRKSWIEPLELVQANREIAYLSPDYYTKVRDLVWIDSPSSPGPLGQSASRGPRFKLHGSAIRSYRDFIIQQLGLGGTRPNPSKKIFLARRQDGNRPYNQDELLQAAGDYGFQPVFFEGLSLRESVEVMMDAKYVIGPHGAGWANALFSSDQTRSLMWTWEGSRYDNWFTNVCEISGGRLDVILIDGALQQSPFELPTHQLKEALQRLIRDDTEVR
jgi:hypothetical protein